MLRACAFSPVVDGVRAITRRPPGFVSDRVRVFIHDDFLDYSRVSEAFRDVDAYFWCLGISATQVPDEAAYRVITHDFAMAAAWYAQAAAVAGPRTT